MAIVKEYKDGQTTIRFDDEFVITDENEIEKIMQRYADTYTRCYIAQERKRKERMKQNEQENRFEKRDTRDIGNVHGIE